MALRNTYDCTARICHEQQRPSSKAWTEMDGYGLTRKRKEGRNCDILPAGGHVLQARHLLSYVPCALPSSHCGSDERWDALQTSRFDISMAARTTTSSHRGLLDPLLAEATFMVTLSCRTCRQEMRRCSYRAQMHGTRPVTDTY